jgi:putative redox protein
MRNATARRIKGYEHEVEIRDHRFTVDETKDDGGGDAGPRPTELLAASLATCTAITIEMYANRKEWELGQVEVSVDFETPTPDSPPSLEVKITIPADLTDDQRERILTIAGKCPVHRTLASQDVKIEDSITTIEA